MSLKIWVKVGTHALGAYFLKSKRKYPKIGDRVEIKRLDDHGAKWRTVIIRDTIYDLDNHFTADLM